MIAVLHELHWLPAFFQQRVGLTPEGLVTPEIKSALLDHTKFHKLKISEGDLERLLRGSAPTSYSAFVTALFDLYGARKRKPFVGEKAPNYVRKIPTLHDLWPRAKFIHLIRDGRDVYLSVKKWTTKEGVRQERKLAERFPAWQEDPTGASALFWEWHVRLGRESGASLGTDLYYEIRYESLVADPDGACAGLCDFLDVPYDDAMVRFHEGRQRTDPGLSAKRAWLPPTSGLRDWRTQMAAERVIRFEAAAGQLLDELAYERAVPSISQQELDRAARTRERFAEQVRARERPLPRAWASEVDGASTDSLPRSIRNRLTIGRGRR
jgi:hypothetical protein